MVDYIYDCFVRACILNNSVCFSKLVGIDMAIFQTRSKIQNRGNFGSLATLSRREISSKCDASKLC